MTGYLDRLSVRAKLAGAFGVLLLCIAVMGLATGLQAGRMAAASEEVASTWMPSVQRLGHVSETMWRFRQLQAYKVLASDAASRAEFGRRHGAVLAQVEEAWRHYEPLVTPGEERRLADAFLQAWREYRAGDDRLTALLGAGDTAAAARFLTVEINPVSDRMREALEASQAFTRAAATRAAAASHEAYGRLLWAIGIVSALGGALAAATAWWLDRNIVARVTRLAGVLRQLARRDYAFDLPCTVCADEIGNMARAIEECRAGLRQADETAAGQAREQAVKAARAARVESLVRDFEAEAAEALRAVAAASAELDATAGVMQGAAQDGGERAASLAAASEQADANVATVAASTEEMAASIAEVARQVAESARAARQAAEDARATDAAVGGLAEAAGRIGEVVRLISGIAGQTNLLALNATIEAARAGEHGKGFAVVASEVKQLAQQTAKATEEIGAQITAMQAETTRAVEAIRGIGRTIEGLDGLTAQVAAAAEEQAAATREIGRAVAEAASGTREVSRHAGGVTEGAQQTGAAASQVRAASGELARKAEGLRGQVDAFLSGLRAA